MTKADADKQSKLAQMQALGRGQLGRMVGEAPVVRAEIPPDLRSQKPVTKQIVTQNVTPRDETPAEIVTPSKRGRRPKHASSAERQRAYRQRKSSPPKAG